MDKLLCGHVNICLLLKGIGKKGILFVGKISDAKKIYSHLFMAHLEDLTLLVRSLSLGD